MFKNIKLYFNKVASLCFKANINIYAYISTVFLLLLQQSQAKAFDLFSPNAKGSDLLIKYIIEPLKNSDVTTNGIAAVSQTFLYGLLAVGAILLIYTVITGNISTALAGELMGKKFSTTFTVVRNVVGVGMLIPISGGYAAIQFIILWMATQGVLLADSAWENFVTNQPLNTQILINRKVEAKILSNVPNMVLAQYCSRIIGESDEYEPYTSKFFNYDKDGDVLYKNQTFAESNNNVARTNEQIKKIVQTNYDRVISVGFKPANGVSRKEQESYCGQFVIKTNRLGTRSSYAVASSEGTSEKASNSTFVNFISLNNINTLTGLSKILDLDEMQNKINAFHEKMYQKIIGVDGSRSSSWFSYFDAPTAYDIAKKLDTMDDKELAEEMIKVANGYTKALYKFASEEAKAQSSDIFGQSVVQGMTRDGIASAGAWYWAIVSQGSNFSDLINNPPDISTPKTVGIETKEGSNFISTGNLISNSSKQLYNDILQLRIQNKNGSSDQTDSVVSKLINAKNKIASAMSLVYSGDLYSEAGTTAANAGYNLNGRSSELVQLFLGDKVAPVTTEDFYVRTDENPVITVHTLGKKLVWWAQGVIEQRSQGRFQSQIGDMAHIITLSLIVPGATMVWYIPLLPFILWIGTLIGWVLMVLQALFGAPLWMLAHLTPDKESFIGRQGQGYMMILGLFIRPILMVIGLVISIQLLNPIGQLINAFFGFAAMTVLGGTGVMWLIGLVAVTFIYAMILQNTIKKIFSLIHVIPDSLLQWFGGSDSKVLGEYANGIEQGAGQGITQMGGALNTVAMRSGRGIGGGMGATSGSGGAGGTNTSNMEAELGLSQQDKMNNDLATLFGGTTISGRDANGNAIGAQQTKGIAGAVENGTPSPHLDQMVNKAMGRIGGNSRAGLGDDAINNQTASDGTVYQTLGGYDENSVNQNTDLARPYQSGDDVYTAKTDTQIMQDRAMQKASFTAARQDGNMWQMLTPSEQNQVMNSGALNYSRNGKTYSVPPQAILDANNNSISSGLGSIPQMQKLNELGVTQGQLADYASSSVMRNVDSLSSISKENMTAVRQAMTREGSTFDLNKRR